jgi:hypothetical protein
VKNNMVEFSGRRSPSLIDIGWTVGLILIFGCWSVLLGQDASWDSRNYHVYNPYAYLNDRIGLDLAPAQLQSYFNPLIDLPGYLLQSTLSPRWAGFIVGAFQGLNAVLVFGIARLVCGGRGAAHWLGPLLLALAGCLNVSFVAQLGTAAGDSTSSVFVLVAVYLLVLGCNVRPEETSAARWSSALMGLLLGLAAGLKLTNAVFAVAMFVTLTTSTQALAAKAGTIARYAVGAGLGFVASAGWWYHDIWLRFGNPLFPQFNRFYGGPLANPVAISDTRWGPTNWFEALIWPWFMSLQPHRIHDTPMFNLMWLAVFSLLVLWLTRKAVSSISRSLLGPAMLSLSPSSERRDTVLPSDRRVAKSLLIFIVVSYLIWLKLFSIGRYMMAIEVLLPICSYMLLRTLLHRRVAMSLALVLAGGCFVLGVVKSGFGLRAAWADWSYSVQVPPFDSPAQASLLIATAGDPIAWLLPAFPKDLAILRISGNFPRSARYDQKVRDTVKSRTGTVYVMVDTFHDWNGIRVRQLNLELNSRLFSLSGICPLIDYMINRFDRYQDFKVQMGPSGFCEVAFSSVRRVDSSVEQARNLDALGRADDELAVVGYKIMPESCNVWSAKIGSIDLPYQLCQAVEKRGV